MNITINNKTVELINGETVLETALRAGFYIPYLCYFKGTKHNPSCMICAVKNLTDGQIFPSCSTIPTEKMNIETDSEEIKQIRTLSLELLLSDHRADCEAPCSLVCPHGLNIEKMLFFYDKKLFKEAYQEIANKFSLPEIPCDNCKIPCEKACRRRMIDKAVEIHKIIKEISCYNPSIEERKSSHNSFEESEINKNLFHSKLGRFTEKEKKLLKTNIISLSGCLHCACAGKLNCKLRYYATAEGIKRPRYEISSAIPAMSKQHIINDMWFEPAKCIRCGLCVYNSNNGFTFQDRGFGMQVIMPEENRENVDKNITKLCPTGALYLHKNF